MPITAFWIMPWGMLAFLLLPFGAEHLALVPMGWGIDAVVALAHGWRAGPGSVTLVPAMPPGALVLVVAGGLWLCLWRRRWRLLGLAAIAAGLILTLRPDIPDVLVDGRAKLFAVRTAEGELALSTRRSARFAGEIWLRRAGLAEPAPWPADGASGDGRLVCDSLACLYRAEGRIIALVRDPRALAEDCAVADVVIALVPVDAGCVTPVTVIDRFDIWREGAPRGVARRGRNPRRQRCRAARRAALDRAVRRTLGIAGSGETGRWRRFVPAWGHGPWT